MTMINLLATRGLDKVFIKFRIKFIRIAHEIVSLTKIGL